MKTDIREHHLNTFRSARFYTMGKLNENTRCLWLVCHGYGQLAAEFIRAFETLETGPHFVVAPEALSRFYVRGVSGRIGATWMTSEDRRAEITDYVNYLENCMNTVCNWQSGSGLQINALGFSQGTATICRWFANTKHYVDNLFLWGGLMPPELPDDENHKKFRDSDLFYIIGDQDHFLGKTGMQSELNRLSLCGLNPQILHFEGGHTIEPVMLDRLAAY